MSLKINDHGKTLDDETRQFTQRRFQFALSRFDSRISEAAVTVHQTNIPGKPIRHECRVSVDLKRATEVLVTENHTDFQKCIARAAERTGRAVGRAIERSWDSASPEPASLYAGTLI